MTERITSAQNPKIKQVVKLRKAANRKSDEAIIIEGRAEISLAMQTGLEIISLFYCQTRTGADSTLTNADLAQTQADKNFLSGIDSKKITEVTDEVFHKISYREHPDGYLALAKPVKLSLEKIKFGKNPLIVILESVEKPGNLGAILRTTDAARIDAVIVCDPQTDIYNPNVIRSSLGTVFTNQVVACESDKAILWLKANKIKIYATTPAAEKFYYQCDFTKAVAIVIGAEHSGLSQTWLDAADEKIKIPMRGEIDSLNASVAAAVVVYESIRQRMDGRRNQSESVRISLN